jgi:hypothetical protein
MFSAITDNPQYFEARQRSPVDRNWSWSLPLKNALHVVHSIRRDTKPHEMHAIHERVVADNAILPRLADETLRENVVYSPHPVTAKNGPELLAQLGFSEGTEGEIIWT